jgi:predicted XRE-type DNA-binding protein
MKTKEPKKTVENPHFGSDFDDFLEEEGIRAEVEALALKKLVSLQLQEILESEDLSKSQLAIRMNTSRTSVNRMLDPLNPSLTVASLGKVAAALGRKLEFRFVRVPGNPKRGTGKKAKKQAIA